MNITGINKAEILAALYNNARVQGFGILHAKSEKMTTGMAEEVLKQYAEYDFYFDYLHGRVMKISLAGDELNTRLYNRDNGPDAAEKALAHLFQVRQ